MKGIVRYRMPGKPFQRPGRKGWWLRVVQQGRRRYKAFPTQEAANAFRKGVAETRLTARLTAITQTTPGIKEITVEALIQQFLAYCRATVRPSTAKGYEYHMVVFRKYLKQISIRNLSEVTRRVVDSYLAWRADGGYTRTVKRRKGKEIQEVIVNTKVKRKTLNTELTVLRELFNRAMDWNYVVVNPTRGMKKLPLTDATPARVLSREELSQVCAHAPEPYRTMFRIYAGTGLRLSELQNVRREDIDLKRELLFVRSRPDTLTKSGKDRVVPIPKGLLPAFDSALDQSQGEFPFRHENGIRRPAHRLRKHLKRAAELAEIPGWKRLRLHDLRHTYATHLAEADVNIRAIQKLGGWSSLEMVERYSNPSDGYLKEAVERLAV